MNCEDLRTDGTIAIVGGGPAGLTLARLLQQRGYAVTVLERDASPAARSQGGSLDLRPSLAQRAIDAAGLGDAFARASRSDATAFRMIDSQGVPLPGAGAETHEDAGPEIDRGDLRMLLLESLAPDSVTWGRTVLNVAPEAEGRWCLDIAGHPPVIADLVVGADGMGSKVRRRLTSVEPTYTGQTMIAANIRRDLWRGSAISDLLGEGSVMFAGGGKTIFVQRCARDLILVYYSLAVDEAWPTSHGFDLDDREAVLAVVAGAYHDWSPELLDMLMQVEGGFHRWPLSVMPPTLRWETQAGLTLIGDASHAMPPFTGNGVNLAMFDALELADALTVDPAASVYSALHGFEHGMQERTRKETGACLDVGRHLYGIDLRFEDATAAQMAQ